MSERKISEVVLSIEEMVKQLIAHSQNQDMLLKNLANRISKLEKPEVKQTLQFKQVEKDETDFPEAKVDTVKKLPGLKDGVFVSANQVGSIAKTDFTKELNETFGKKTSVSKNQHVIVPVQQKIVFASGEPVTMASVELLINSNGKLDSFKKLKTNATGKWTHNLPAGEYVLKVFKNRNYNTNEVRIEQVIVVPESDSPVQLDTIQAKV